MLKSHYIRNYENLRVFYLNTGKTSVTDGVTPE